MDQQDLINRIVALAQAISLTQHRFVDVRYDGTANQLQITVISRDGKKRAPSFVDLHEPGEPEISRERVNRNLRDVVTHLESLHSKTQQRSFSL